MDDKHLTIHRWVERASHDLRTARVMLDTDNAPTDIVCFHSQQCAEKSLKAFLVLINCDFPKTHDLMKLLSMCISFDSDFNELVDNATYLVDYAVEVRYVDDWRDIPEDEATDACRNAEIIFAFVNQKLSTGEKRAGYR